MKMVFLLISQIGLKNVCISTRLLLQAILCVNLSKIFRGLRPQTPAALARGASRLELVISLAKANPDAPPLHVPAPPMTFPPKSALGQQISTYLTIETYQPE